MSTGKTLEELERIGDAGENKRVERYKRAGEGSPGEKIRREGGRKGGGGGGRGYKPCGTAAFCSWRRKWCYGQTAEQLDRHRTEVKTDIHTHSSQMEQTERINRNTCRWDIVDGTTNTHESLAIMKCEAREKQHHERQVRRVMR